MASAAKRNSDMRWKQGHCLSDRVIPSLENSSQAAIVWFCWFKAGGRKCEFDSTLEQIAAGTSQSVRSVKRSVKRLTEGGVIKTIKDGQGRRGAKRRITFKPLDDSRSGDNMTPQPDKPQNRSGDNLSCSGDKLSCSGDKLAPLSETETVSAPVSLRDGLRTGRRKKTTSKLTAEAS